MKKLSMIWIVFSLMFIGYRSASAITEITDFSDWNVAFKNNVYYDYTTEPGSVYVDVVSYTSDDAYFYLGKKIPGTRGVKATINVSGIFVEDASNNWMFSRTGILQSVATLDGIRIKGYIHLNRQLGRNTITWMVFKKYDNGVESPIDDGVLGNWTTDQDVTVSVMLVGNEIWFSDGFHTKKWRPQPPSTMTPIDSWTELFTHVMPSHVSYGNEMHATYKNVQTINTIDTLLIFFDQSVADASLIGDGKTPQASNAKLNALKNMILNAQDLIVSGNNTEACTQLLDAYQKTDGQPNPPDFVTGSAASELATMIEDLRDNLQCP